MTLAPSFAKLITRPEEPQDVHNDNLPQYSSAKAAAARYTRLRGSLPGEVRGIDYERMAAPKNADRETVQDRALEALDEYRELALVICRARRRAKARDWRLWFGVRINGATVLEAAEVFSVSERQAYRVLKDVDRFIERELVERDMVRGHNGRDMIEAGGSRQARGISVYRDDQALWEYKDRWARLVYP